MNYSTDASRAITELRIKYMDAHYEANHAVDSKRRIKMVAIRNQYFHHENNDVAFFALVDDNGDLISNVPNKLGKTYGNTGTSPHICLLYYVDNKIKAYNDA